MTGDRVETKRRLCGLGVLCAALCIAPAAVQAQEGDPPQEAQAGEPAGAELERARALFGEGVELADDSQWDAAAEKFREALAIKGAPAVRFNLASALYESGDLTQAHIELQRVLEDDETPANIREPAEELAERMDREAGRLTPQLEGSAEGVTVRIDGRELPADGLGEPVVVSAGEHTVTAHRDGQEVAREPASVQAGEAATVTLSIAPSTAEAAAAAPPEEQPAEPSGDDGRSLLTDWRLWLGVGAAVVVIAGVAVAVAVAGGGTQDPIEGDFEPGVLTWN